MDIVGDDTHRGLFLSRARSAPARTAAVFVGSQGQLREYSFEALQATSGSLGAALKDRGVGVGDRVAVKLANRPEFLIAWLAADRLGAVLVPCNVHWTPEEDRDALRRSRAKVIVCEASYRRHLAGTEIQPIFVDKEPDDVTSWASSLGRTDSLGLADEAGTGPGEIAEIMFTSGTTSRSKGVLLTHHALLHGAHQAAAMFALRPDDRLMNSMPLYHANAQILTWLGSLLCGGTAIFQERFSARSWVTTVGQTGATVVALAGTMVRMLMAQTPTGEERDHDVRAALFGVAVEPELWRGFERRFGFPLLHCWGLTEASLFVTAPPLHGDRRPPSIGRPALGRKVEVRREDGTAAAIGEVGELVLKGEPGVTMMLGYLDDEQSTAATVREGWLYTGDLGRRDSDGYLYFVDRRKAMIKRSGENVSALEVEMCLLAHPSVEDVAVIGVPDPIRDEAIVAFLVPRLQGDLAETSVIQHANQRLAWFKRPSLYVVCEGLPRNETGKVDKKDLSQRFRYDIAGQHQSVTFLTVSDALRTDGFPYA